MTKQKTMKDVVTKLREESVGALLELFELHVAVTEIARATQTLSAGMKELAAETATLASIAQSVSPARLRNLADFARSLSHTAEAQAAAFEQLKQGLAAGDIAAATGEAGGPAGPAAASI